MPALVVWGVPGKDVELPCDVTPDADDDRVSMILWFKDTVGIPLYRLVNHLFIHFLHSQGGEKKMPGTFRI